MGRKSYKTELKEILQKIPEDRQAIGRRLCDELEFLHTTLEMLRQEVKEKGVTEHFINGKQDFYRESTALATYNKTLQRYSQLYRQLVDLMPKAPEAEQTGSALYDFLKGDES
jgi:hypothetical protein